MASIKLFDIALPQRRQDAQVRDLYFRCDNATLVYPEGGGGVLRMPAGGVATFDTFFNLFSYGKYRDYTTLDAVSVQAVVKGRAVVSVRKLSTWKGIRNGFADVEVLASRVVDNPEPAAVEFGDIPFAQAKSADVPRYNSLGRIGDGKAVPVVGFYYLQVVALEDGVEFHGGGYFAQADDVQPVKLAIGICTYRREEFVRGNIERLCAYRGFDDDLARHLRIFVADNGQTLDPGEFDPARVGVFPNRNYGGSGGFTRTLVECLRSGGSFTHMLFMDDDIDFDPGILQKTTSLLRVLKPEFRDSFIGGSTLHTTNPVFQFEQGSHYQKKPAGRKRYSVVPQGNLLENEREGDANYCGWTYSCFPLSAVAQRGLPMPFFIRADDAEFTLRNRPQMIFMNGIGVWHEPYLAKYSTHLAYYDTRNKMIVRALHEDGLDANWEVDFVSQAVQQRLQMQVYDEAEFMLMAVEDFLAGVDLLLSQREDEQLKKLLAMRGPQFESRDSLKARGFAPNMKELKAAAGEASATGFAGRISARQVAQKTVDYDHYEAAAYEGVLRVIHWSKRRNMGKVTELDAARKRDLEKRLKRDLKRLAREYEQVALQYRARAGEVTSLEYWMRHLGL